MNEETRKNMASSQSVHWCSPTNLLDCVYEVNDVALDPCSNKLSVVQAKRAILPDDRDGLNASWATEVHEVGGGLVYVNPPYGRQAKAWVQKAVIESARGSEIILLVGARTETKWFQDWLFATAHAICFWKGRLTFIDGTGQGRSNPAFFPSAVAYWGPQPEHFIRVFSAKGRTLGLR